MLCTYVQYIQLCCAVDAKVLSASGAQGRGVVKVTIVTRRGVVSTNTTTVYTLERVTQPDLAATRKRRACHTLAGVQKDRFLRCGLDGEKEEMSKRERARETEILPPPPQTSPDGLRTNKIRHTRSTTRRLPLCRFYPPELRLFLTSAIISGTPSNWTRSRFLSLPVDWSSSAAGEQLSPRLLPLPPMACRRNIAPARPPRVDLCGLVDSMLTHAARCAARTRGTEQKRLRGCRTKSAPPNITHVPPKKSSAQIHIPLLRGFDID